MSIFGNSQDHDAIMFLAHARLSTGMRPIDLGARELRDLWELTERCRELAEAIRAEFLATRRLVQVPPRPPPTSVPSSGEIR